MSRRYCCEKCGKIVNPDDFSNPKLYHAHMANAQYCFECASWFEIIKERTSLIVISGHAFMPQPTGGGECYHNLLLSTGKVIRVDGLVDLGEIPVQFKQNLPNNARVMTYREGQKYDANRNFQCKKKGCWDRKVCLWFSGPMDWNIIPTDHKIGNEFCPLFINKIISQ